MSCVQELSRLTKQIRVLRVGMIVAALHVTSARFSCSRLENKLPSIEDRGHTDRVAILAKTNPVH